MSRKYDLQLQKFEGNELDKFWKFYKQYKSSNKENAVRLAMWMSDNIDWNEIAKEIDEGNQYYNFIKKFLNGEVVTNKYGKYLFWKF